MPQIDRIDLTKVEVFYSASDCVFASTITGKEYVVCDVNKQADEYFGFDASAKFSETQMKVLSRDVMSKFMEMIETTSESGKTWLDCSANIVGRVISSVLNAHIFGDTETTADYSEIIECYQI